MTRIALLPDWRTGLSELLDGAPDGATIVVETSEQKTAVLALMRRLKRGDLSVEQTPIVGRQGPWYFVSRRGPDEFEVDLLNEDGSTALDGEGQGKSGRLRLDTTELIIAGETIPRPVLEAAKQRVEGHGEYVDASGQLLDLWGRPQAA